MTAWYASPLSAAELAGLFGHFMLLGLLSVGGVISTAPDMQRYAVVEHGWLSAAQFSASIAIAQAAPGPNVLFVAAIGWNIAGPLGALATMGGILVPSVAISIAVGRWGARRSESRAVRAFATGMTPITIGLLLATGWILARPYVLDAGPATAQRIGAVALVLATVALALKTKISPMWLVAAGAVVGAVGLA